MAMTSNGADYLVNYGDYMDSEIGAGGVTRAELGDALKRSCVVSQNEKSAQNVLIVHATKD